MGVHSKHGQVIHSPALRSSTDRTQEYLELQEPVVCTGTTVILVVTLDSRVSERPEEWLLGLLQSVQGTLQESLRKGLSHTEAWDSELPRPQW